MALTPAVEERIKEAIPGKKLVSLARIMLATDFSAFSEEALDCAVSLAQRFQSTVYLTHVLTFAGHGVMEAEVGSLPREELWDLAKASMKKIEDSGRLKGVPHEVVIEQGGLWPTLENLIKKHEIDLLVVGTHGTTGVLKMVIGSSAEEIFRQATIPVLTVGPAVPGAPQLGADFKNIVFATDFGPAAKREATYAFALAQEHGARLVLMHVSPQAAKDQPREAVQERENVTRTLAALAPAEAELAWKPEYHLAFGEPVEEILRVAEDMKADLIVLGAKKRESLAGHVPHTKAYRVVCGARCPVLTIRC